MHIAEADSFLRAHQRYAVTPLTPAEADRYVAQACVVATRLGVLDPPTTVAGLDAAIESYRPELAGTPAARDAARFLPLHPPLPWSARPGYGALAGAGVALPPRWARQHLALPSLPLAERAIALPLDPPAPPTSPSRRKAPPQLAGAAVSHDMPPRSASARASAATVGHSGLGRSCPTPAKVTRRAPSMALAVARPALARTIGSFSP